VFFGFKTRSSPRRVGERAFDFTERVCNLLVIESLSVIGVFMFKIVYPKQFDLSKRNPGFILFHVSVSCCSYLSLSKQLILVIQVSRLHTVHL